MSVPTAATGGGQSSMASNDHTVPTSTAPVVGVPDDGSAHDQEVALKGEEIYDRTLRSTVWIIAHPENMTPASGTGCLIDAVRGHILTNMHVVDNATEVWIFPPKFDEQGNPIVDRSHYLENERPLVGRVVRTSRGCDLALIELDADLPMDRPIELAERSARPGQTVYTLGNPGASGALWVFTSGTVRQVYNADFRVEGNRIQAKVIETQNPVNPGDSGGPVVNDRGQLVALTQSILADAHLVSRFIDISEIRAFLARSR
jgi:serine protease Do